MSHHDIWAVIILAGIGTYLIRLSFIVLQDYWEMPEAFKRSLRYVPPAVFSALIAPSILMRDGQLLLSPDNHRLLAALAAVVAMLLTKNILATIATGMLALWTAGWLLG
ncbi:MAG: AzlD domain-containing protein [Proteobacteria bacterium]|nr:AzlD domain-containing protein [Pseudomonadota bacterium]